LPLLKFQPSYLQRGGYFVRFQLLTAVTTHPGRNTTKCPLDNDISKQPAASFFRVHE